MKERILLFLLKSKTIMEKCPCYMCPVNHGMDMICFLVCKNLTARCGKFYLCVAIWVFQYVSPGSLIFGPKYEAMKDIFGFVLTARVTKSVQWHILAFIHLVVGGM
jgi:hypothetical protein